MNYLKTFLPYLFGNKEGKSYVFPNELNWEKLNFEETLMFHTLQNSLENFTNTLDVSNLSHQQIYHLFGFQKYLSQEFLDRLKKTYTNEFDIFSSAKKGEELRANEVQEILNYKNYTLSVFAIFNKDRSKPGRMFVRDGYGHFVHKENGEVWSIPTLGVSGRGLPFNHSNGTTPCGVYSIDSVMPEANKNKEFGKFRRLIVNFLKQTPNEENIKQFLPRTHHKRTWWIPCIVGRDLGRSLLRIHGTGTINKNPFSSYFPMIPSSGCLTTTERSFMGIFHINHQRELLDTLMKAQGLPVSYENELKIQGILYVIEFNDTYQALEFKS
jgi:hypothetical protein